jgi:hypothetical protein
MWIYITSNRLTRLFLVIPLPAILLLAACGEQSGGSPEAGKPKIAADIVSQDEKLPAISSPAEPVDPEKSEPKPREIIPADPPENGSQKGRAFEDVDWGREINLDKMITMAKKGQIVEIQWHVMPNILRAQASDGRIYHIRNENKGVDLRNTLINAGVKIGKEGVLFRYLF